MGETSLKRRMKLTEKFGLMMISFLSTTVSAEVMNLNERMPKLGLNNSLELGQEDYSESASIQFMF